MYFLSGLDGSGDLEGGLVSEGFTSALTSVGLRPPPIRDVAQAARMASSTINSWVGTGEEILPRLASAFALHVVTQLAVPWAWPGRAPEAKAAWMRLLEGMGEEPGLAAAFFGWSELARLRPQVAEELEPVGALTRSVIESLLGRTDATTVDGCEATLHGLWHAVATATDADVARRCAPVWAGLGERFRVFPPPAGRPAPSSAVILPNENSFGEAS